MASCGLQQQRSAAGGPSAIASRLNAAAEAAAGDAPAAARWAWRADEDEAAAAPPRTYDVFINHRGVDTKHNVARLLYDRLEHLSGGRVRSFLDNKSMRPGDRLEESIDEGIRQCKVAVAIFSRRYFDSEFCLRELASIVEARKLLIPIFYGIKPSELILPPAVEESKDHAPRDIERFRLALQEAKYTVGLTYDPATGDLAELVYTAANAVMDRIQEMDHRVPQRQMIVSRL
ncbi:disease resistance-like protein CSA1 [Panicum miliaceum]|uniref:Disease resistance-like protein CSA1 n=1 Tax=Panicum miliaceum TaxID=4540 RepID=A0A3L6QTE9_PANMI|nr:disease resistance-like protein CSA1 [Panicum miliaceum]